MKEPSLPASLVGRRAICSPDNLQRLPGSFADLRRVPLQAAAGSNVDMAPVRSNADGVDRGDGVESDRKVRRFVSAKNSPLI